MKEEREKDKSNAKKSQAFKTSSSKKRTVTINLSESVIEYFKELATKTGIPYQTLINLYLEDCADNKLKLKMKWK